MGNLSGRAKVLAAVLCAAGLGLTLRALLTPASTSPGRVTVVREATDGAQRRGGEGPAHVDALGTARADAPQPSTTAVRSPVEASTRRAAAVREEFIAIRVATSRRARRPEGHAIAILVVTENTPVAPPTERVVATGRTGADGRTTLPVHCPEALEPGSGSCLLVRVTEPGFHGKDVEVAVHGIGVKPRGRAIVRPTRGFIRRVQVVDQGGRRVDVIPWVKGPRAGQEARSCRFELAEHRSHGAVDVFVFDDPSAHVIAHHPRIGRGSLRLKDLWHEGPTDVPAHLVLRAGAGIRGRLVNRFGEPLAGVVLHLRESALGPARSRSTAAPDLGIWATLWTDATGEFQSIGLPERTLMLMVDEGSIIATLEPEIDPARRDIVWDRVWVELAYEEDPDARSTTLGLRCDHDEKPTFAAAPPPPRGSAIVAPPDGVTRRRVLLAPGRDYVAVVTAKDANGERREARTQIHVPTHGVAPPFHLRSPSSGAPPGTEPSRRR